MNPPMSDCLYCYKPLPATGQPDFHEHCSLEFFGEKIAPVLPYTLDEMADLAKDVIERRVAVPGVQPKISLSLVQEVINHKRQERLTIVGALGGNYIFKPPNPEFAELPQNEHLTMRMAESFDIRTVPSSLIRLASGELSFITRRIDRTEGGEKIHMLDMFQITEAFNKYRSSMERIGKALQQYAANTLLDLLRYFELAVFAWLTGNNDMHLKNFSMIVNDSGEWELSPAYDLLNVQIIVPKDVEELALTLNGRKRKLTREDLEKFGRGLGLSERQLHGVFARFAKGRPKAEVWIRKSFLSPKLQQGYLDLLDERYGRLT
jgi:serine/threonine-protein kinase HipA